MRHYVTTAYAGYLPQLRALHASLQKHARPFFLHVLAEGPEVTLWAARQPDVRVTPLGAFLARRPQMQPENLPGPPRNGNERACTWRWTFALDVMIATGGAPLLAVDADIMFWSDPEAVFDELRGAVGLGVLPHAFAREELGLPGCTFEDSIKHGRYNGGFVYFAARAPLEDLAEMTRRWNYIGFQTHPDGRVTYGDQGRLDELLDRHGGHVIEHVGAAPGPWNIHTQTLTRTHDGAVFFGGRPLVSYHYQSLRPGVKMADPHYAVTGAQASLLYGPYLDEIRRLTPP